MSIFKMALAGVALSVALPAAAVTTINFDQLPNSSSLPSSGTTISTQYASLGVTFRGTNTVNNTTGPLNAWGLIPASGAGGSGNYLANFGAITPSSQVPGPNDYLLAPRYNVMSFLFADGASGISFGLNTQGGQNSVNIAAYDAGGGLLQSLTNVQANNGTFDIKSLSASNVARVDITGGTNGNGSVRLFGIDNLTFTANAVTGAVPEPGTWAMMIVGFGLVGGTLRRSKSLASPLRAA